MFNTTSYFRKLKNMGKEPESQSQSFNEYMVSTYLLTKYYNSII